MERETPTENLGDKIWVLPEDDPYWHEWLDWYDWQYKWHVKELQKETKFPSRKKLDNTG